MACVPHIAALDKVFADRLAAIDLSTIFVYDIENVNASALPYLAEQFDVLGYNGFLLATTDLQKRAVIKRAIELHRYKGTIWAVKEALKTIGYVDVQIVEHINGHWARFKIVLATGQTLNPSTASDIRKMVFAFKNVRSHLDDIELQISVDDEITFDDETLITEALEVLDEIRFSGILKYDGSAIHDGTFDYSGDTDTVTIN